MSGSYCQYCDHRCFVLRQLKDGRQMHLATCPTGAAHDMRSLGEDHTTAINPSATAAEGDDK